MHRLLHLFIALATNAQAQDVSWTHYAADAASSKYAPLGQIDKDNFAGLSVAWRYAPPDGRITRRFDANRGTPLVVDGVLYYASPLAILCAVDAVTGEELWTFDPESWRTGGNFVGNLRGIAYWSDGGDERIIFPTGHSHLIALDATTGELVWETQILDYKVNPANQTSGPIVANGKVISGRSCAPKGGPNACVIVAHDATNGRELWRRRLIPAPGEPGNETWGGVPFEERKHVGAWMVPSFDPELNLVYIGTSVTSPAPKFLLGGTDKAHLYHNSTLALDADTGEIVWYYQHLNDHWDLDHPFERLLVDTIVAPDPATVPWINPRLRPGEERKVITGIPGKTGIVYTLDRVTGEFLWATPTVAQNVITSIDGATGAVSENSELVFEREGDEVLICPTFVTGGKDWEAGAYSPLTRTMYYPLRNACARMLATTEGGVTLYALAKRDQIAPGTDQVGTVQAISVETGEIRWVYEQRAGTTSLVATGGGLIFGGDGNGRFRAFDQENGDVLWEVNLGSSVTGFPITYAVDGTQYVVASTGSSLSSRDNMRLTPELRPSNGNNLFVFALP